MPLPAAFRALESRNFRLFVSGQLISLVGTWMDNVAEAWLVYRLTGSSVLLGMIGFCNQIPVFLLAPIGGMLADRVNRHRIIIGTQFTSMMLAGMLAWLALSGRVQIWHIFVLAGLMGVVNAFDIPARQAFLVDMVGREHLINAIALNSSMFNASRIVGPAVAGLLVASIGEGWCFAANSISYIAVLAGLFLMRVQRARVQEHRPELLESVKEGFRFVTSNPPIYHLLILLGVMSVMGMPYSVLMPIFADRILHGGPRGLGILMGASGVGALIGALVLATRKSVKGLGRWVSVAAIGFGVALGCFSFSRSFPLSVALMAPVGFCMMIEMGSSNTLVQSMVPDHLRGRVMSVYSMMFMGMAPIGALYAGTAANHLGAPLAVTIGGGICAVGGILFGLRLPVLRTAARELIVAAQMTGGEPAGEAVPGVVNYVEDDRPVAHP